MTNYRNLVVFKYRNAINCTTTMRKSGAEGRRQWKLDNPEKQAAYKKKSDEKRRVEGKLKQVRRRYDLKRFYGITPEQYDEMYFSQDGRCAVCGDEHKVLHVDHCHSTKVIRGLLCMHCNTGIGKLKHDVVLLSKAIEYLTLHTEVPNEDPENPSRSICQGCSVSIPQHQVQGVR